MPNLHIRDVPVEVVVGLKAAAQREGRSLNKHVLALLEEAAQERDRRTLDEVLASIDESAKRFPLPPDAPMPEDLIRQDRDSR
jgi:plasmid stability protein